MTPETVPDDAGWVYFGLTAEQYEALSLNMKDILEWMQEMQWYASKLREQAGE